jgi:type II secretory pathway pseudopilin PulG
MFLQRWRRFLPERSQLIILVGVLAILYAGVAFVNLAMAKSAALRENQAAQTKVDALQEQQQRLRLALGEAQQGYNIEPRARQYFNLGRKGEKAVVLQPVAPATAPETAPQPASGPPYWTEWWKRLTEP